MIRAVITRQADAVPGPDQPLMGTLDRFEALRAWADADLEELSYSLLTALQGGVLMTQTMRTPRPLEASMNAALAYVRSFAGPEISR